MGEAPRTSSNSSEFLTQGGGKELEQEGKKKNYSCAHLFAYLSSYMRLEPNWARKSRESSVYHLKVLADRKVPDQEHVCQSLMASVTGFMSRNMEVFLLILQFSAGIW